MFDAHTIGEWLKHVLVPGLGSLVAGAIFALLRRYIKRLDDARLRRALLQLVRAAEQMYGPGRGADKRRYVIEQLRQQGLGDRQRHAVEAAVYELNMADETWEGHASD